MQTAVSKRELITWGLLAVSAISVHLSHQKLNALLPGYASLYHNKRLIMKPLLAKAFALGFDRTMADIYWLLFIQYYGDFWSCQEERYRYAPDYLRLVITLDPHFIRPYWFTAFVLAGDMSSQKRKDAEAAARAGDLKGAKEAMEGCKKDLAEATRLLDEGIAANPDQWDLPYIAGFSQYVFARNDNGEKGAAYYYRLASKIKGAPAWLEKMATIMDSGVTSRIRVDGVSWQLTFENTKDGSVREKARKELQKIWSQVYYYAATETIRKRAENQLKYFEVDLLPKEVAGKPSSQVGEDFVDPFHGPGKKAEEQASQKSAGIK